MEVILGIDIGGSTTKIVGLRTDGSVVSMLRVRAEDQVTSLYGALGNYLTSNGLSLGDVRRVVLTGVGASYVDGDVFGLPTCRVDEFQASGTGALALSGQTSGVVVTMGTGTAFLWAEAGKEVRPLCGSGIGGGTLGGLCRKLVGMERFYQIKKLAAQGDLSHVDLTISDIARDPASTLDPNMTAANFGDLSEDATPYDGAGLSELPYGHRDRHRLHDHAGSGGAKLCGFRKALRHPLRDPGKRHLRYRYRCRTL